MGNHVARNNNGSAEQKEVTLPGDVQLPGRRRDVCVIGGHEAATRVPDRRSAPDRDSTSLLQASPDEPRAESERIGMSVGSRQGSGKRKGVYGVPEHLPGCIGTIGGVEKIEEE